MNQLGFVTLAGIDYFAFSWTSTAEWCTNSLLSLDTLRIWGAAGHRGSRAVHVEQHQHHPLADLDLLPNLQLVYALGPGNVLMMDYNLFAGSGLGYDLSVLIPTRPSSAWRRTAASCSRPRSVVRRDDTGADAADGFEEWAICRVRSALVVPEPDRSRCSRAVCSLSAGPGGAHEGTSAARHPVKLDLDKKIDKLTVPRRRTARRRVSGGERAAEEAARDHA